MGEDWQLLCEKKVLAVRETRKKEKSKSEAKNMMERCGCDKGRVILVVISVVKWEV